MKAIKKTLTTVVLAIILAISSLMLISCGKSANANSIFKELETIVQSYSQSSMFISKNLSGVIRTKFYLDLFASKDASGEDVIDGENQLYLIGTALNYIEKNYTLLSNSEAKYDYGKFSSKIKELNESYKALNIEYTNLKNLPSTIHYEIYNGFYARYKLYTKDFINKVYEVAVTLGDCLVNNTLVSDNFGTEEEDTQIADLFVSYHLLLLSKDYKEFFINSCEGAVFENHDLYFLVQQNFDEYLSLMKNIGYLKKVSVLKGKSFDLKELLIAITCDRKNAESSLNKFSFYEFCDDYQESLPSYSNFLEDAETHYFNISNYYVFTLIDLQDYLNGALDI